MSAESADVTTREDVDAAFKQWGSVPEAQWPVWLRNPKMDHHLNLAVLLTLARQHPEAWGQWMGPEYDEKDQLVAIRGIALKRPARIANATLAQERGLLRRALHAWSRISGARQR
ncbi:MAG TPA: hypothetical protein VGF29_17590 [Hyphomicrobiaceae bacterium]|jgi:hypothetical protein